MSMRTQLIGCQALRTPYIVTHIQERTRQYQLTYLREAQLLKGTIAKDSHLCESYSNNELQSTAH